ncbi:hypothetical protein ES703_69973 [subsurface metagenome]
MTFRGIAFPGKISTCLSSEITGWPTFKSKGAKMYRFSPSLYFMRDIKAERFGSYSIVSTTPGTPILSRLKSIMRYNLLCPPPRRRTDMRPREFLPPDLERDSTRGLCGRRVVNSSKVSPVFWRKLDVAGL